MKIKVKFAKKTGFPLKHIEAGNLVEHNGAIVLVTGVDENDWEHFTGVYLIGCDYETGYTSRLWIKTIWWPFKGKVICKQS